VLKIDKKVGSSWKPLLSPIANRQAEIMELAASQGVDSY
jgi:hypothetical protein